MKQGQAPGGAQRWRSLAEMPDALRDSGEPVLLYKPDEPRDGEAMYVAYWGEWPGDGWCWIRCGGRPIAWVSTDKPVPHGVVTHWMPLPPPPSEQE